MTLTINESSAQQIPAGPEELDAIWRVISRSHIMRFWPGLRSREASAEWIRQPSSSLWFTRSAKDGYGLGIVTLAEIKIHGRPERVLSYAFDRCLAGRAWALESIRAIGNAQSLKGAVCLIGPAMANSERVAKAVGFVFESEVEMTGIRYCLYRYSG